MALVKEVMPMHPQADEHAASSSGEHRLRPRAERPQGSMGSRSCALPAMDGVPDVPHQAASPEAVTGSRRRAFGVESRGRRSTASLSAQRSLARALAEGDTVVRGVLDHAAASDADLPAVAAPLPTISVVIPTLNEAGNLPYVLERLPREVTEVIIVDGNSTDDSVAVALQCRPDARIVLQDGRGKGNAMGCGFRAVTCEVTVMLDADGSTDPAEIPRFVSVLTNGFDFAKGTRFVTGGGSADITPLRRAGNWALTTLVNRIWSVRFSDLCYGYNAFWTDALPRGFAECNGFEIETLLNIRVASSSLKVMEVPSHEAVRRDGTSNLEVGRDGARVLRTILAEWMRPA